jgi:hypothetical protein
MMPELTSKPGSIAPSSFPTERRAPIAELTPTKRKALIVCLEGGGVLYKHFGVWSPSRESLGEHRIYGITVADLGRDGLLSIGVVDDCATARLTPRGSWFARAAASSLEP